MFPALAGMNRLVTDGAPQIARVPRARGDEPGRFLRVLPLYECSPRSRG